jgi:Spy/CpxP family protein refolding chaperone
MQRSKNLAMMFLLGAVLVGGAVGFTADRVWMRDARCSDPRASKELLYDRLELGAAQRAAFDSILDDRHRQFDSLFKPIRPQMDSIRARSRAQMRALLTSPEQRQRFEAIIQQPRPNEKRETTK